MKNNHTLILGGMRSGKSKFAENLALKNLEKNQKIAYIATAKKTNNKEMSERIKKHISRRGNEFITYEEETALSEIIKKCAKNHDIILIDCLTLWLTNLYGEKNIDKNQTISNLKNTLKKTQKTQIIMVSNEVGLGIIPTNKLARDFIDITGLLHQDLASICNEVYFIAAGLPLKLK